MNLIDSLKCAYSFVKSLSTITASFSCVNSSGYNAKFRHLCYSIRGNGEMYSLFVNVLTKMKIIYMCIKDEVRMQVKYVMYVHVHVHIQCAFD